MFDTPLVHHRLFVFSPEVLSVPQARSRLAAG